MTEAKCGGEGARGGAGALISSPSPAYKVFVTGTVNSVLSEVGIDTPGALLDMELVTPAQHKPMAWS